MARKGDDPLILMVGVVLIGGFAVLAMGNLDIFGGGGTCSSTQRARSKTAWANTIATFVGNHLNKTLPSQVPNLGNYVYTKYPSAVNDLTDKSSCATNLPTNNPAFYKALATYCIAVAKSFGVGYS